MINECIRLFLTRLIITQHNRFNFISMSIQVLLDRFAIGLSLLCAIHCVLGSIFIVTFPLLTYLSLTDENFHQLSLYLVVPVSVLALLLGYWRHKKHVPALYGVVGLLLFTCIALWGHDLFGHSGERVAAILAGGIIAYAHLLNYRMISHKK